MTESIGQDRHGTGERADSIGNHRLPTATPELVGIRGWLLVFVIWAGLNTLVAVKDVAIAAAQRDFLTAGVGGILGLLLLADILLIMSHREFGKTLTLVTCGLIAAINFLATLALVSGFTQADLKTAIQAPRDCILFIVWWLYFHSSQRVANTLTE